MQKQRRCADCRHVEVTADEEDGEKGYRCGYPVPFWVPLPVHDYRSWVQPDDGKNCNTFEAR
jgi:hypothetical protein